MLFGRNRLKGRYIGPASAGLLTAGALMKLKDGSIRLVPGNNALLALMLPGKCYAINTFPGSGTAQSIKEMPNAQLPY